MSEFFEKFSDVMQRCTDCFAELTNLARLSGGATMESWSFDYDSSGYVLRRAPSAEIMEGRPFGHDVEAALVRAAFAAGVKAPEVVGELETSDGLGTGYIMRRVEAEVNPAAILANPPGGLIDGMAGELAKIHNVAPRNDLAIPYLDPSEGLADFRTRFASYGGDRPIIALALRWCEDNLPPPAPPVLVHGDFRMGNVMVDANGLAAVLDWELAHWGDRHDDIAYGCLTVWRFGQIDKPAFGVASLEAFFAAYEAAGGEAIDPVRFRFWMVYRTLWWALGCLQMADYWRSGADRTLERAVIGRRTSENELDLLMLLDEGLPAETFALAAAEGSLSDGLNEEHVKGEPSATEMLEAVREWIESDVKAKAQGREKFLAAVAMNALGMVQRELANPVQIQDRALSDAILAGKASLETAGLLTKLRNAALTKLANDVPKYAALNAARQKWS